MDCVNHSSVPATAYCQNCGKALCPTCTRTAPGGQVFCAPCFTAWHSAQNPFFIGQPGAPSPQLAAVLGVIPGVGAMYNGQFLKGLVHVMIFAVLISASHLFHAFGLLIFGWICYQVFDAYHTAKARRDGEPLPDPLGLNDVGNWFGMSPRAPGWTPPPANPAAPDAGSGASSGLGGATPASPGQAGSYQAGAYQAPFQAPYQTASQAPYEAPFQTPSQAPFEAPNAQGTHQQAEWQAPYQGPYQNPGATPYGTTPPPGPNPYGAGFPPVPPIPPMHWRRREPVGAIILIALGLLFLLDKIDFLSGRVFAYSWPLALIGLGVWLIVRRMGESQGGPK
jgi:TM2 domain-containing membrane protein YozV